MQVCDPMCFCNPRSESRDIKGLDGTKTGNLCSAMCIAEIAFAMQCAYIAICALAAKIHCDHCECDAAMWWTSRESATSVLWSVPWSLLADFALQHHRSKGVGRYHMTPFPEGFRTPQSIPWRPQPPSCPCFSTFPSRLVEKKEQVHLATPPRHLRSLRWRSRSSKSIVRSPNLLTMLLWLLLGGLSRPDHTKVVFWRWCFTWTLCELSIPKTLRFLRFSFRTPKTLWFSAIFSAISGDHLAMLRNCRRTSDLHFATWNATIFLRLRFWER